MNEVIESKPQASAVAMAGPAANSPMGMMLTAMQQGVSPEQITQMMDLQERWEANEAKKAFNEAFAAFKAEAVEIIKRKQVDFANSKGGRTQYKHAELSDVVEAVGPALSKHGFSWSWNPEQQATKIKVTCTLLHRLGHEKSACLEATADESGGKNSIQAIASTTTYLERHTLKAVCGLSEKGDDMDGSAYQEAAIDDWGKKAAAAADKDALRQIKKDGEKVFNKARDKEGIKQFYQAVNARLAELGGVNA